MKAQLAEHDIDVNFFAGLISLTKKDCVNQRYSGDKIGFPECFTSCNIDVLVKFGLARPR